MKLEMIMPVKNAAGKNASDNDMTTPPKKGDILTCTAIAKQGDAVLMRSKDGGSFMARMSYGTAFDIGDSVEMIVTHAEDHKFVFKVIDVMKNGTSESGAGRDAADMPGRADGAAIKEMPGDANTMNTALAMIKDNPGLPPKLALFLAASPTPRSPEDIEVLTQMFDGRAAKLGTVLERILNEIAGYQANPMTNDAGAAKTTNTAQQQSTNNINAQQNIKDSTDNKTQTTLSESSESIEDKIISMFLKLGEKDSAAAIKRQILDLPEKIKELKLLNEHNDNEDNEGLAQKAGRLEHEQRLMSQIKRVACFQIPFYLKGQPLSTADLYVYRHRSKKVNAQADIVRILIGIDTLHMGRAEALITARNKDVSLRFGMEQPGAGQMVRDSEQRLAVAVAEMGYHLARIETHELKEKTTMFNAQDVLTREAEIPQDNIDVKI